MVWRPPGIGVSDAEFRRGDGVLDSRMWRRPSREGFLKELWLLGQGNRPRRLTLEPPPPNSCQVEHALTLGDEPGRLSGLLPPAIFFAHRRRYEGGWRVTFRTDQSLVLGQLGDLLATQRATLFGQDLMGCFGEVHGGSFLLEWLLCTTLGSILKLAYAETPNLQTRAPIRSWTEPQSASSVRWHQENRRAPSTMGSGNPIASKT